MKKLFEAMLATMTIISVKLKLRLRTCFILRLCDVVAIIEHLTKDLFLGSVGYGCWTRIPSPMFNTYEVDKNLIPLIHRENTGIKSQMIISLENFGKL